MVVIYRTFAHACRIIILISGIAGTVVRTDSIRTILFACTVTQTLVNIWSTINEVSYIQYKKALNEEGNKVINLGSELDKLLSPY